MHLVDIGLNLAHRSFDADRAEVLDRARRAGVIHMVVTGTSLAVSRRAVALAERHPGLLSATAGVHPHDAKHWGDDSSAALSTLAARPQVLAIGECGLDFDRDFSPRPAQERCFETQLELAAQTGLPVFLHERGAHERFTDILAAFRPRLCDVVVHCFTGSRAELRRYLDLDAHIGITGWICDERRGRELQRIVSDVPVERLMIETDAPFLTPRDLGPKPPRRNEPAFLPHVLRAVARCRGDEPEALARAVTATTSRFFGLRIG
ncbi:MAG: TatD family hydrolase [Myxococcales bacterium]|nr:TatD family hydrolase [Myxococcales bacterium]